MKKRECYHCKQAGVMRRDFLTAGALSLLGITLSDVLRFSSSQPLAFAKESPTPAKAQAVILLFLEGGVSQLESWDVKANSSFKPIPTNVPGVQIAEIFPTLAKHMDKLSIIRSMKTEERNHPQAVVESLTGHRPTPALKYPSFGSIVSKELGPRENML